MSADPHTLATPPLPLYVDLDGTLIRTDLLHENFMALLRQHLELVWRVPFWLLHGRARLKARLAETCDIDASHLPYREELLAYLRAERAAGRALYLATAANEAHAWRVAQHLGIFDDVLASSGDRNLKGRAKCRAIIEHCANSPFAYAGNARADIPIWKSAAEGIVVGAPARVAATARRITAVTREFDRADLRPAAWFLALRPHQWLKNLLVFVPLIAAHLWASPPALLASALAFVVFCLSASGAYVVNDLLDVADDRRHPRKRFRPIASGALPMPRAVLLSIALFVGAALIATQLDRTFLAVIESYVVITFGYTALLKKRIVLDALTLAALYTVRVIGGAVAIAVTPSFWLLAFMVFLFSSLALTKRCSELVTLAGLGREAAHGRDYRVSDATVLQAIGIGSGLLAVLVLALFINSSNAISSYSRPELLWALCVLLLYWISRMWIKTGRGEMHDDPVIFAARDPNSLFTIALAVVTVVLAV
jgi:4-hydroxybenzoate polyprenyltransferase